MKNSYSELIIKAPFILVKGFLMGFMYGREKNFDYFFHRKSGIRRETMGELFRELFELDCHTYLCLPNNVIDDFIDALEKAEPKIGVKVESRKRIEKAEFTFSFEIFNPAMSKACQDLFSDLPEDVELVNFDPKELKHETMLKDLSGYAPIHAYAYQGEGTARGDFEGVMNFYLKIKKSNLSDAIVCSDLNLQFEGEG